MNDDKYKKVEFFLILFIIILGFYYMYLAFNTQMLGEDEASYINLAKEFMNFEYLSNPYVVIPFIPLFYSSIFFILGTSLGLAKAIIAAFGILTLIVVYLFCKKIDKTAFFGINIFGLTSISIILTISYFTHFMLISYTEIPIAFFSILIAYLLLEFKTTKNAILVGIIIGLANYVKSSAVIFPAVLVLFALAVYFFNKDKRFLKLSLIAFLISMLIITPFILRNLILFKYPQVEGLNLFFKPPIAPSWASSEIVKTLSLSINLADVFGYLAFFLGIFGVVYAILEKSKKMLIILSIFLFFILIFYVRNFFGWAISDPRYFSIVFPEIAIIGGYYISKVANLKKYLPLLLVVFFIYSLYISMSVAISTSQSQRYPNNYIDALKWVKLNTNKNDLTFTAYGGSLSYYGERKNLWATFDEFPEVMTTTNSTRIYEILKNYNASYILVWRGILADRWIIPESNIYGAFTYNFLNQVYADKTHFNLTYSNDDNFIFKML